MDGNLGVLAFAALKTMSPQPPPIDDNPPLHIFMLSLGFMLGRAAFIHQVPEPAVRDAMIWIAGKRKPQEIVDLIWG